MTNLEPESVEPTPEAADDASVAAAPEAPETPEAEVTAEAKPSAPKSTAGLIAGLSAAGVLVVAGLVILGLWLGGVIFKGDGDPAKTVKDYFAARTCKALQATMAPADWSQAMASAKCDDTQLAQTLSTYRVKVGKVSIDDNIANVEVSVTTTTAPTAPAQKATINLIKIKDHWKVDHVISPTS